MPKFKADAQQIQVAVAEVRRRNKHSPGFRYQMTVPKVLAERAKSSQEIVHFKAELVPEATGLRVLIFLEDPNYFQRRQLIRKALRLGKSVIGHPEARTDQLSDQLLELSMSACFNEERFQEITEYLAILSELNLHPQTTFRTKISNGFSKSLN
ncbi:MAG: hypothetical protein ACE5OZ_13910 [Candidatus Heimdallarchaeota archaeon]